MVFQAASFGPKAAVVLALSALLTFFSGCSGPTAAEPVRPPGALGHLFDALGGDAGIQVTPLPPADVWRWAPWARGAVLLSEGWRKPALRLDEPVRQGLRRFVEGGGRLLLLGYTAALARDLGLEERPADVCEPCRWGFDARTQEGRARLGFRVVSGRVPDLVAGLTPAAGREHVYFLAGGQPMAAQGCWWEAYSPAQAEVLGVAARERDGVLEEPAGAVLLRWSLGRGAVLACGLMPDPQCEDAAVAANAAAFLSKARQWLCEGDARNKVAVWHLPRPPEPVEPRPMLALGQRELPAAPLVAHWGWQVATSFLREGGVATSPDEVLDQVLLPSFRAGADLIDLHLPDRSRGYPLPWSMQDPLRRPPSYRGDACSPEWNAGAIARLCREAHARGMLVQSLLWPRPAAGGTAAEDLAAVRFLARELLDYRRLGDGAVDGIGVGDGIADPRGLLLAMVQDFQPGAHAYTAGVGPGPAGSVVRTLDAGDGRVPGLQGAGISDRFRNGFPADSHPAAALDARGRRPDPATFGDEAMGGGAYADWIVTQANDFVRARMGTGAAMWWRAHDPAAFAPGADAVVTGVSLDPVRAAVAGRHLATGQGGFRDLQRTFLPRVQTGFGAEVPVPASVPFLQNNWIKLCGSGGTMLYDPQGLGRFRPGDAVLLAPELMRTRLRGNRPDGDELRIDRFDAFAGGKRPEGGFGPLALVGTDLEGDGRMPPVLARGEAPRWPERTAMQLSLIKGVYDLDLSLRGIRGRGVVEVRLDGEVLYLVAFATGRPPQPHRLRLDLARDGPRSLELAVVDGGAVAVERLQLLRGPDCAAEARVGIPAGHCASLLETSASSYHHEEAQLVTLADFPGFLWSAECTRGARGLRLLRTFQFPRHRELRATAPGDSPGSLRSVFVLRGDAGVPDLAVVPLVLGRYDRFELGKDGELTFSVLPDGRSLTKVGFVLLHEKVSDPNQLLRLFAALDRPLELDLAADGTAQLTSDLPIAWTRLLRLQKDWRTPYLVRENGWWLLRGAQAMPDGSDLLRICHRPGDTVLLRSGPALMDGTRPGPGSARLLALRDPEPTSVTVRVLQQSCLLAMPSVVMGAPFDEVRLDDQPWHAFDGTTVFLPPGPGTWQLTTARHGGVAPPRVLRTGARLERCTYDAEHRELLLVARADPERPAELPLTAVVAGGEVIDVINGAVVAEPSLRFRDGEQARAAARGGTVIRFLPGLVRVRFRPEVQR